MGTKDSLRVQDYYQGNTCIWVPKQKECEVHVEQHQKSKQLNRKAQPKRYTKGNKNTFYIWRKKAQMPPITKVNMVANHKPKDSHKPVWVRKEQSSSPSKDQQGQLSQQIKHIPSKEMQLRILNLQVLIFGMASIQRTNAHSGTIGISY